ncbi:N/A [soil metagenome]
MPHRDLPLHKRVVKLLQAALEEFGEDMAVRFGAALSFYTLFSLVPLLFLVVAVVGFVSSDSSLTIPEGGGEAQAICADVSTADLPASPTNPLDRMLLQVEDVVGTEVADQLARLTCQASDTAGQALSIGIALALFTGSSVFLHVQGILNHIFDAPQERTKGFVNMLVQRAIAMGWALLLATLVFVPIVAVATVRLIQRWVPERLDWLTPLLGVAVPLASVVMLMVVVALTFQFLSRVKVPWQAARRGGMFTAVVGLAGAFLVGTYLQSSFGGGGALGALGGVAILLFFFNLMWIIYLFGAEVTRVYADYLVFGDVMAPSQRVSARPDTAVVDTVEEARSARSISVTAFVMGVVTGWAARRRR